MTEKEEIEENKEEIVEKDLKEVSEEELDYFNWGAFLLTWLWCSRMGRQGWAAISFFSGFLGSLLSPLSSYKDPDKQALGNFGMLLCLVSLGVSYYIGITGNKLAWKSRKWESFQQFKDTQNSWMQWGIVLVSLFIFIFFLMYLKIQNLYN